MAGVVQTSFKILAVAIVSLVVGGILGYLVGHSTVAGSACSPNVSSGVRVSGGGVAKPSERDVNRCMNVCSASASVGMDLSKGMCLNSDIDGFACAVVVDDHGHCPAYYRGTPEIVLNADCKYVDVYKYAEGGSS